MENSHTQIPYLKSFSKRNIKLAIRSFSRKEWYIFLGLFILFIISFLGLLGKINSKFLVDQPMPGGSITEGIVGTARFINPILAFSDTDKDMTNLLYSGLMRKYPDGSFNPDLAESYEVSKDGLTYTFILKDKIYFHDGSRITADDVIFTINSIKDPLVASPKKTNWSGVNVEKIDEKTVQFTLRQPYGAFLENATLGIMPKAKWENSPLELNELNTNPIGSGPYQITKVGKQNGGTIDYYNLVSFSKWSLDKPFIKKITIRFYKNEQELIEALEAGKIEQASSISPANAEILTKKEYRVESSTLPRVFGLFFNQNQNQIFTDKSAVMAIDKAIDKDKIIRQVLSGYGEVIDGPLPPSMEHEPSETRELISKEERIKKTQEFLEKNGWKKGEDGIYEKTSTGKDKKKSTSRLQFSISTGNAPELAQTAELIKEDLEASGMKVEVKTFEVGNLNQSVIRPRQYDALLFGEIINNESDLYAFWHSSQRKDPGLNVAIYTNVKVDKILEDTFKTNDIKARNEKYAEFEKEIKKDNPAVFLYTPKMIYVVSKRLNGLNLEKTDSLSDRFLSVNTWYTEKDRVWKIFSK